MILFPLAASAQGTYKVAEGFQPGNGMQVTEVPNITMTYGGRDKDGDVWQAALARGGIDGFPFYTAGNGKNPTDDKNKAYTASKENNPTHGTYYRFEPMGSGKLTVYAWINANKSVYVTEDGKALSDYSGQRLDAAASKPITFDVMAGSTYYVFCTGSKMGFFGFTYETTGKDDPIKVRQLKIGNLIEALMGLEGDESYASRISLTNSIDDAVEKYSDAQNSTDSAELDHAINALDSVMKAVTAFHNDIETLAGLITKYRTLLTETHYRGWDTFNALVSNAEAIDLNAADLTRETVQKGIADVSAGYMPYAFSKQPDANGAVDVTEFVTNPDFTDSKGNPTAQGWSQANTGGWGDYKATNNGGRNCWNSWSSDFQSMDIHQTVKNLPTGYYATKASAITNKGQVTTQHAYTTTSMGTAVSPVLADSACFEENKWGDQTSSKIYSPDGTVTMGYASTSGGGTIGWFCVTNFKLLYYGNPTDEELAEELQKQAADERVFAESIQFKGDKADFLASINNAATAEGHDNVLKAMKALQQAHAKAEQSNARYASLTSDDGMFAQTQSMASRGDYGDANDIVKHVLNATEDWLAGDNARANDVDSVLNILNTCTNSYAPLYNKVADGSRSYTLSSTRKLAKDIIDSQHQLLTTTAITTSKLQESINGLTRVLTACNAEELMANASATDYTSLIVNPDVSSTDGWTVVKSNVHSTMAGEHYSGDATHRYFDDWNGTPGALLFRVEQKIASVPNGTYTLRCAARTSGDKGVFVYALADNDTLLARVNIQQHTEIAGAHDGSDTTYVVTNTFGAIWEEASEAVLNGTNTDEQRQIYEANGYRGYGWEWIEIPGIVVNNHQLTIGLTCDSTFTHEPFTGTWMSGTDFSLTLTARGDNGAWSPVTGVKGIEADTNDKAQWFDLSGRTVSPANARHGIFVVRKGGKAVKVVRP